MFLMLICIPLITSEAEHLYIYLFIFKYLYIYLYCTDIFLENAALKICAIVWFYMHLLEFHFSFHEISTAL